MQFRHVSSPSWEGIFKLILEYHNAMTKIYNSSLDYMLYVSYRLQPKGWQIWGTISTCRWTKSVRLCYSSCFRRAAKSCTLDLRMLELLVFSLNFCVRNCICCNRQRSRRVCQSTTLVAAEHEHWTILVMEFYNFSASNSSLLTLPLMLVFLLYVFHSYRAIRECCGSSLSASST